MAKKRINLALLCTRGGHFEQLTNLSNFYQNYDHLWITNKNKQTLASLTNEKKYFIKGAQSKEPWIYLYQIPFVIRIFAKEKPTHFLSTGSGKTAFIPFIIAKLFKVPFFYIDTFSRVNGYSKFGRFLHKINHPIFVQWKDTTNKNVQYIGPVFKKMDDCYKNQDPKHIFVTLGTRHEPFSRLIETVEDLVKRGSIKEKVIIQAGKTKYASDYLEIFDFCTPEKIDDLIINSKYVITQESAGIGTKCLKYKTKFLVMPRQYKYGEVTSKSDEKEDLHLHLEKMGYTKVINNALELEEAISEIEDLKVGFTFDNKLAIDTLTRMVEGS